MTLIELLEEFVTLEALATVPGLAVVTALLMQVVKPYLSDWRYTPLAATGLAMALSVLFRLALDGSLGLGSVLVALIVGFFGSTAAVYGYEVLADLLGRAGIGGRSDSKLLASARRQVETAGYVVVRREPVCCAEERLREGD